MKRLLACLDVSSYSAGVVDATAWAAARLRAEVELLHVVQRDDAIAARHDLSGAVGLGAKSQLLEELAALDEQQSRLRRERGKVLLSAATGRLEAAGVRGATSTHRHGGVLETIIEREAEAELVVIGKRGGSSEFAKGHLGSLVERVVRESIRPVFVVPAEFEAPKSAFLCFDSGASSIEAFEFLQSSPMLADLDVTVAMAGHDKDWEAGALDRVREALPKAEVLHLDGSPHEALPKAWKEQGAGLVLMGAYGHSPLRRWIVGSTTTLLLRAAQVPVLVFR